MTLSQPTRRGLLMMAAAAGVSLATPRLLRAALAGAQFGGDLTTIRAAIERQRAEAVQRLQHWIAVPSMDS